jgi:hypothetical protein
MNRGVNVSHGRSPRVRFQRLATLFLAWSVFGVTTSGAADTPLLGAWAGNHISLELNANGGTVDFDCAHGEITRAVVLDAEGRFDLPGRYAEEHGGPARQGDDSAGFDVRYAGRVQDGKMRLSIRRGDTKALVGKFMLTLGAEPTLVKCR